MFPKYYSNALTIVNPNGYICITTFWTKQDVVYNTLTEENKEKVLVIGNLYTKEGIKYIIKNSLLCPQIEYFVFTGYDRNNIGKYLMKHNNLIPEQDLEQLFIDYFTPRHQFIQLKDLNNVLSNIQHTNSQWIPKAIETSDKEATMEYIDNEYTGFVLRDYSLERLWKRILTKVRLFGTVKGSDNDSQQKELLSVVSVLMKPAELFDGMPNKEILESYIPQVTESEPTEGLSYTYGSRLHSNEQIENCIKELTCNKNTRRAVSVTWQAKFDSTSKNPPCLVLCDFKVQREELFMTCYFRSHDAYNAYCMNIYALQQLQFKIANKVGLKCGYITCVSNSCHVYSRDFAKLGDIMELDCMLDERGYFLITTDNESKNITCTYYSKHDKPIKSFTDKSVHKLMDCIQPYVSEISHALYLGKELHKAKTCIKNGLPFTQS